MLNTLDEMIAREVLSPVLFRRREAIAFGNPQLIAKFKAGRPPWTIEQTSKKDKMQFFHVLLGLVPRDLFVEEHTGIAQKTTHEANRFILGSLLLDGKGRLLGVSGVGISSLAWAAQQIPSGSMSLSDWFLAEKELRAELHEKALKELDRYDASRTACGKRSRRRG